MTKMTLLLMALVLSGCTSPMWWIPRHEIIEYRGYMVNIGDQNLVREACYDLPFPLILGCASEKQKVAWSVPNYYVLKHECAHIDGFVEGWDEKDQVFLDVMAILTGFNEVSTILTEWIPVDYRDCGDEAIPINTYEHCTRVAAGDEDAQDACEIRFETPKAAAIWAAF